jgi:cobalt-zinc-cadmium efflux system protein
VPARRVRKLGHVSESRRFAGRLNKCTLRVEGSFQHILTDLYAFIGTALAAVVILLTGFDRADPIASLFVAALMF